MLMQTAGIGCVRVCVLPHTISLKAGQVRDEAVHGKWAQQRSCALPCDLI